MVILANLGPKALKVEYVNGSHSKGYFKTLPPNAFVAMKDLTHSSQISNKNFLAQEGITIYDYESNTYFYRNPNTPPMGSLPFLFIGNNVKPGQFVTVNTSGFSGTTTASGMTFIANAIATSTVFGFITSANTVMANNTISATTIGNNRYISFSGAAMTTTNWAQAIASGATLPVGVTITGFGAGILGTSTVYLSATTVQALAGLSFLQRLV